MGDVRFDTAGAHRVVDLRSDTVTRPSAEMREAMKAAAVGDDVYGEDPTVNALEQEVAAILGKEAAMLTPSGTMANQIAILLHTRPGESVICEEGSHVYVNESGAGAALAGVQFDLVPLEERLSDAALEAAWRPEEIHAAPSSLLVVENTHNRAAGRVLAQREIARIAAKARVLGLRGCGTGDMTTAVEAKSGRRGRRDCSGCSRTSCIVTRLTTSRRGG